MTKLWNQMPVGVKEAIASAYDAGGLEAAGEIAERMGLDMTGKNLQRRVEEHTKFMRNVFHDGEDQTVVEALAALKPTWSIPPAQVSNRQNPIGLTDIYHIDVLTDQGPWLEWLNDAAAGKRYITVMHAADIHFPFEHQAALEVFYQLVEHIQPDLIVVGSDAGDFALVSTFARDPDLDEETSDVLDEFKLHWDRFVERLRKAAPNAFLVWIWGNHERRILRFVNEQAPKFRKRILRDFITIIRAGGAVAYVGYTDYVRVGPLVVHHGTRTGIYAAKNALLDAGSQISLMGGHVHYPSTFDVEGEEATVHSLVSGCLCAYPHYMQGVRMTKPPQLGTGIGDVDLRSRDVELRNIGFKTDMAAVWTRFERTVFTAPVEVGKGLITYEDYLKAK